MKAKNAWQESGTYKNDVLELTIDKQGNATLRQSFGLLRPKRKFKCLDFTSLEDTEVEFRENSVIINKRQVVPYCR